MKQCQNCGKWFDETTLGKYCSGKYCSRSCANTRHCSEEIKNKISNSVKRKIQSHNKPTKKFLSEQYSYKEVDPNVHVDMPIRKCVICNKHFYHFAHRKTCSKICNKLLHDKLNELQRNKKKVKYKTDGQWNLDSQKTIYQYYFTYKTINLINNKYYYGIHMTNKLEDGYLGSGKRLKQAIKKYGKENFKRIILNYYSCYKDLAQAEHELITSEVLLDENCYNLTIGGIGGPTFKGHKHSEQTKEKLRQIVKNRPPMSEETKKKISESQKGRVAWNKGLKMK